MDKRLFFLLAVASVAVSLSGCHYQRGYRSGYAQGRYQIGWHDGWETSHGRSQKDRVRDLEMENAALRAANKHLLELENGRR